MCGICGAINHRPGATTSDQLRTMVALQRHRGPDDAAVVDADRVLLGQARLSIVDVEGGSQPMSSHDGRLWVVFNGEIFNYVELREELRRMGARFRTRSDTEVILEAYRAWGICCFSRFNGQWGLAIWDVDRRRVVLSRDRVGIRPLYHTRIPGGFLFASEIKALFSHPAVQRKLDPVGITQTFTFWAPVAPRTAFCRVEQIRPGCIEVVSTDSGLSETDRYWAIEFGAQEEIRRAPIRENALRLRETLVAATRLRFDRSDVPVGAYLSGGLDSTVTTSILSRHTDTVLETFSVRFPLKEFDEGQFQKLAAESLGTRHHSLLARGEMIADSFPDAVRHAEQPLLRTAPSPLFLLSDLVRRNGIKVVVTGEGADEVLAGYDLFRESAARRLALMHPECAAKILGELYPWMIRSPGAAGRFGGAFLTANADPDDPAFSHRPRWSNAIPLMRLLAPEFSAPHPNEVIEELLSGLPGSFACWNPLERAQFLEMHTLLPGYILSAQGDRMLMAHSVEGRFPFLDHRVIEFAASLPPEQKLNGFEEKHILKEAFARSIPPRIAARRKQPYRAPDAACFTTDGVAPDWLHELTNPEAIQTDGVFRSESSWRLLSKVVACGGHRMSNADNMSISALISTTLLVREMVDSPTMPDAASRDAVPCRSIAKEEACNSMSSL